jgi:hypothetical protein
MAGAARFLPKWQAEQILCQTPTSKYHAKQKIFFHNLFLFFFVDNADT